MTEAQAIAKATEKCEKYGRDYLVIDRPSHRGLYVIAKDEKYLWTEDEVLVFDTSHPDPSLEVSYEDGATVIRTDAITAARLAGRRIFGRIPETQKALEDAIRDAWYAADCPR